MKRTVTILLMLIVPALTFAQAPDTLWTRTIGGSGNEECKSFQQTSDGGYILGGETGSFGAGSGDVWLVKTDANGDSLWSRTFGGSSADYCNSVQQTTDGGYVLGGGTWSHGAGGNDFWMVKTDANGDSLWSRTFGGSNADFGCATRQTTDGGYILGGITWSHGAGLSDFWLVKTDANGDSLWSRTFGGSSADECYSVQQTSDGGYVLGGGTWSHGAGGNDFWLVKTDATGTEEWNRTFGGNIVDECYSVQQTTDGGYILGGYTSSFGAGSPDCWLVKTDANGDSLWSRTFGGSNNDFCYEIQQTTDDGYILGGRTASYGAGSNDFWMVKTDANGDSLWSRTFGGSNNDYCYEIQQTSDGGYVLGGYTESYGAGSRDFWLVKTGFIPPVINSITDVGNDQGRQARIRWYRCIYDGYLPGNTIESYSIYRRVEDGFIVDDPSRPNRQTLDWPDGDWEYVATVPARGEAEYNTIVETLADSSSVGIHWSAFFVSAETPDPLTFFDSEVDSGYSVDNLAPEPALITAGFEIVGSNIMVRWDEVTTGGGGQPEQNGIWYRVHGSADPDFVPAVGNLLETTQQLSYEHPLVEEKFYFKILVSDDH